MFEGHKPKITNILNVYLTNSETISTARVKFLSAKIRDITINIDNILKKKIDKELGTNGEFNPN